MNIFSHIPSFWRLACSFSTLIVVLSAPLEKKISLAVLQVRDNGATLCWKGSDINQIPSCEYSYMTNGTMEIPITTVYHANHTIELTELTALTSYSVYLTCQMGDLTETGQLNFTTAPLGKVLNYTCQPEFTPSTKGGPSTKSPTYTDVPSVIKNKIGTESDPIDVALGVIFGIIALGVVCTIAYYFFRKFRRQQRIRRFLQYRQQENDPFPDIDAEVEDDDSNTH